MSLFSKIKFWLNQISQDDLREMRETLELYLLNDKLETQKKLLHNLETDVEINSILENELRLIHMESKNFTVELKKLYNLHHEVMFADEILPFYQKITERKRKEQIVYIDKILFIKISKLSEVLNDNQKSFISSIERQTSYISQYQSQPEVTGLYNDFFRNQQKTYFSLVNSLVSELKLTLQLELQNEKYILEEANVLDEEIPQLDVLIDIVIEMKDEMNRMNRKIEKMTEYINSKIDKV